jgi:ABC-type sugar transport system substrate-binding protein
MKRSLIVTSAALVLAGILAACSSSSGNGGGTPTSGTTASGSSGGGPTTLSACVAASKKVVQQAEAAPKLTIPPISGGTSSLKGKSVWIITDPSDPLLSEQAVGVKAAASAVGAEATIFNDHSSTTDYNQGIQEAVGAKASLIVIDAIQTALIQNSLAMAHSANIPVISIYEKPNSAVASSAVKATIFLNGLDTGKYMAAYALQATGCKLNAGVLYYSGFSEEVDAYKGISNYVSQECPQTCKLQSRQWQPTSVATTVGPTAVSFLASNPDANAMLLTLDSLADYVVPALDASHKKVLVVGEGGTPEDEKRVATKTDLLKADVANSSNELVGWTTADAGFRILLGQPLVADDTFLTRMLDVENIPSSADGYFPYTKNFKTIFRTAWGVVGQ